MNSVQNARSYLGRFSGLALFLLALIVVGLLVVFTIRSANEDQGTVTTNDDAATTETSQDQQDDDQPVAAPGIDSQPQTTDDEAAGGSVAGSQDGLPSTGPEDALIPAAVIGLLAWQLYNWRDSRRQLARASNVSS